MSLSFTLAPQPTAAPAGKRKVLVTGAAGMIGMPFAQYAVGRYDLRLMIRPNKPDQRKQLQPFGEIVEVQLSDLAGLKQACENVDAVVHLAGEPDPNATWDELLPANILGTYNLMAAATSAKVRRVVYASSIHAVGGYGADLQSKTNEPPNPGDLYGVSKCFGEALGRYLAEQEGVSVIALRIGAYQPPEKMAEADSISMADSWVSPRDLNQLLSLCIEATHLRWAVFNALSNNAVNRLDISDARELLGYSPQDDAFEIVPGLKESPLRKKRMKHSMEDGWAKSGMRKETGSD